MDNTQRDALSRHVGILKTGRRKDSPKFFGHRNRFTYRIKSFRLWNQELTKVFLDF